MNELAMDRLLEGMKKGERIVLDDDGYPVLYTTMPDGTVRRTASGFGGIPLLLRDRIRLAAAQPAGAGKGETK